MPSFLLPADSGSTLPEFPRRGLTTGRKILAYPNSSPGLLRSAIQGFGRLSPLKPADIASAGDFGKDRPLSVAQVFEQTSAQAVAFEEVGAIVVKEGALPRAFSPASVGSSGQMPITGEEHYVYPISGSTGGPSIEDLQQQLETIQRQLQKAREAAASGETLTPAATGGAQKTWGLDAVKADTSPFTGKNIRVAVIDTGIDQGHPDLASRIDNTWSFDRGPVDDDMGHGTHVAGTIAGSRSGSLRYGMAPEVRLYIAKVFRSNGTGGTDSDVIGAINWAIQQQCQIANMSLSSSEILPPGTRFDPAFEVIAQNALRRGLMLVAAAGNLADLNQFGQHTNVRNDPPAPVGHPANCPSVLAVAALFRDDQGTFQVAPFSNGGQADPSNGQIDFAGPGYNIVSSWPRNLPVPQGQQVPGLSGPYAFDSGTSMAAPHISGVAALLSEKLGGTGGLSLWQALALDPVNALTGLKRRDVGFGMPLAPQS